jgi:hypothetical protein
MCALTSARNWCNRARAVYSKEPEHSLGGEAASRQTESELPPTGHLDRNAEMTSGCVVPQRP